MRKRSAIIVSGVLLALGLAGSWATFETEAPAAAAGRANALAVGDPLAASVPSASARPTRVLAANAAVADDSLRGTEVDGAVTLDEDGRPVGDRGLRRLFDYFLTRLGERPPATIRADLQAHLEAGFDAAVVVRVLGWFDAYAALEQEAVALVGSADPRSDAERLRALRRQRLGETLAEAWYGEEQRHLDYSLSRQELLRDRQIGLTEREQRLAELDATLDPQHRAQRMHDEAAQLAVMQSQAFVRDDVDPSARFAERERLFGREAAQRLVDLDARQAHWQDRLAAYAALRGRVLADSALSQAQRAQQADALLAAQFDRNERRRVQALVRRGLLPEQ